MTRYGWSRASGYPPDPVSFRRYAGAPHRLQPPRTRCGHRARGGLALRLAGTRLGKDPGSGGCTKGKQRHRQGIASHEGKAAPTRATLKRVRSRVGCSQRIDAEKSLDRGRSSETIFCVLEILDFGQSEISENFRFCFYNRRSTAGMTKIATVSLSEIPKLNHIAMRLSPRLWRCELLNAPAN